MTWAVDANGKITDWKPYLDNNGIISIKQFKVALTEKLAKLEDVHVAEVNEVIKGFADKDISKEKQDEIIGALNKKAERAKKIATKEFEDSFTKACQNYVVYNLLKTIKDPKNAIEAATPMAMDKAKGSIKPKDYSKIKDNATLEEILKERGHAMPYAPTTMIEYERLNMDGKTGVGIFASDLKAYFATYYAFISDADNVRTKFASNISSSDLQSIQQMHNIYNIDNNGLVFFAKNPDGTFRPQTLKTLANAFRYTSENQMVTQNARNLASDLRLIAPEEQEALIAERLDDVITSNRLMTEEQAWEDLSELLSASTDNAKELILGRIGANALTSSIISTMIRCGVDIKDALELINSPEISELVQQVQQAQDTQKTIDQFEETGQIKREQLKSLVEAKVEDLGDGDKLAYFSNPYVQFLKFVNITEEFSLTAAAFGINQGIKNDAYSMWSYINRITKGINDVIGTKEDPKPFNFMSFVNGIIEAETNGGLTENSNVSKLIALYDDQKHGINVPYVLYKNAHYLGYFSAMFESKNIRDNISHVYSSVEGVLEEMDISSIDKDGFNGIADYIYGVGIEEYFRKTDKSITLDGITYDLSNPNADITGIPGRHEFIQAVPNLVSAAVDGQFSDNYFLQSIALSTEEPDFATGEPIKILKARDLSKMDPTEYARMHLGLNDPDFAKTPLYDALYLYSLIVNKGSYTQGSFISLFPIENYSEYMNFIKTRSEDIAGRATKKATRTSLLLHNKGLLPKAATDLASLQDLQNEAAADMDPFMDGPEMYDPMDFISFDEYQGKIQSKYAALFNPEAINRKFKKTSDKNKYVTSTQTKMIYGYNSKYEMYLPLVQKTPRAAIPYSLRSGGSTIQEAGFQYGWSVDLGRNIQGRIIGYIDNVMLSDLELLDPQVGTIHTPSTIDPLGKDETPEGDYLVEQGGKLYRYTKDALIALNKDRLSLNTYIIRKLPPVGEVERKADDTLTVYSNGEQFNNSVSNDDYVQSMDINIPFDKRLSKKDIFPNSSDLIKKTTKVVKLPTKVKALKFDFDEYYAHLRDVYTAQLLQNEIQTPGSKQPLGAVYGMFKDESSITKVFMNDITPALDRMFPKDASMQRKLQTMLRAMNSEDLKDVADELNLMTKTSLPKAFKTTLKSMIKSGEITYGMLEDMNKIWNFDPNSFNELIKDGLAESNGNVYMSDDNFILDSKTEKELKIMQDIAKMQKVSIPTSMVDDAVNTVSKPVLRRLAKYLNKRFPHTRVKVLSTAEIRETFGDKYAEAKGFVQNGEVVLNADIATMDTPIHEFSHIYFEHLKVENPALFDSLVQKALSDPLAKAMRKAYPELSNPDLAEEILVQKIADYTSGKYGNEVQTEQFFGRDLKEDGSVFGKMLNWFKNLFGKMFNTKKDLDFNLSSSLGEVIESIGDSVLYKKEVHCKTFLQKLRS